MTTDIALVWSVNLLTGLGLFALGLAMTRRPERVWFGVRVLHNQEEAARVRQVNSLTAPVILAFALLDILSGPAGVILHLSSLTLAFGGLGLLLLSIAVMVMALVLSR